MSQREGSRYLVAGSRPWSRTVFDERLRGLPGTWRFVGTRRELSAEAVRAFGPRYLFFLHWSWKVPAEIVEGFECVCFHMTDLPYGRGGSPLQNLILRGHRETALTAFRMTGQLDAGPVYLKQELSLSGTAEEIYRRASERAADMIERILREGPLPKPQRGEPVVFRRRKPAESEIDAPESIEALYDFIRMLDADGYPRAFLRHWGWRFEFRRARLEGKRLEAVVTVSAERAEEESEP